MQISNKERKKRQHEKELASFRNKMGSNIVWFDSLSKTKKYNLLFEWKRTKYMNGKTKPEWISINKRVPIDPTKPFGKTKIAKVIKLEYPASLKHFIKQIRSSNRYKPSVASIRQSTIELLLK